MSFKAYSHYEQEYELWTMVTQEALHSICGIMGSYSCISQAYSEGTLHKYTLRVIMECFSYDMMIYELIMLMTYVFPLSPKWRCNLVNCILSTKMSLLACFHGLYAFLLYLVHFCITPYFHTFFPKCRVWFSRWSLLWLKLRFAHFSLIFGES